MMEKNIECDKYHKWYNVRQYQKQFENIEEFLTIFKPMKELKERIKKSGLKQNFIADSIPIGESHLTMMLNGNATMPEDVRNKITALLLKAESLLK